MIPNSISLLAFTPRDLRAFCSLRNHLPHTARHVFSPIFSNFNEAVFGQGKSRQLCTFLSMPFFAINTRSFRQKRDVAHPVVLFLGRSCHALRELSSPEIVLGRKRG
jgi:hypothetical protein